ncbi:helix-turn-helix domain-containing protein [Cytobacillus firmus]|uniref:helix-turn-helix domain-containing protein n=1 Tax=Cytobacillus firmus TaxID=1399 RepID=UPI001F50B4FD|nr:helix-turn-helix transcriptional regulator [Cytobacillus firmus]MED1940806.1 helix-turn-helix transcriptional regulator [Cytobacillus firmus]
MNLKVLRLRNRYKQDEVVNKTGINRTLISKYERNELLPTEENLEKLAKFYGVSVKDITE